MPPCAIKHVLNNLVMAVVLPSFFSVPSVPTSTLPEREGLALPHIHAQEGNCTRLMLLLYLLSNFS